MGCEVAAHMANDCIVGKALGVNAQGGYEIETLSGIEVVHGGDISLRMKLPD